MYPAVLRLGRPTVSHGHSSGCDGSRELHGDVAPLAGRAIVVRGHPCPLVHLLFDTSRAAANSLDGASMCTFLEACTHGWGAQWATHGQCGQGCLGPGLVWRVPSLGAPSPSPAWDCGGVMWVDPHPLWVAPEQEGEAGPVRIDMGHESP